jgi:hypothetical protein
VEVEYPKARKGIDCERMSHRRVRSSEKMVEQVRDFHQGKLSFGTQAVIVGILAETPMFRAMHEISRWVLQAIIEDKK